MLNLLIVIGLGIMAVVMLKLYRNAVQGYDGDVENKGITTNSNLTPEGKLARAKTSQDLLLFENIEDSMLKLDSRRYRAYIKVEPITLSLKSFSEQDILQTQFMQIGNGFRYDVDLYIPRIRTNLDSTIKMLEENAKEYGIPEIEEFGEELIAETQHWVQVRSPLSHGFFLIIYFDEIQNVKGYTSNIIKKQALLELDTRCKTIIDAFSRAGIEAVRIKDPDVAQLINFNMKRDIGALFSIRDAIQRGVFNPTVTSCMERKKETPIAREHYGSDELPFDEEAG